MQHGKLTRRRIFGLAIMAMGIIVLFLPIIIGESIIAVLGVLLIAAGLFRFVETIRYADETTSSLSYILGHPFLVEGVYVGEHAPDFDEIYKILQRYKVNIAMAGDTHDFEFYNQKYLSDGKETEMLHFVNGGGGAYLSIGTSLNFPEKPVTEDYAFYPRTDELDRKIRNEAPFWKKPFLVWMDWFDCYPATYETLAGAFDFNRAPFFQSFMEVMVERSQNRVRLWLYGVDGQLRWREIQVGGQTKPADKSDDDFVEFIAPLQQPKE